jgi:hypothetical protein
MPTGLPLSTVTMNGEPVWVAGDVGRALNLPDFESGSRWARRSKDFRIGTDGMMLRGEALAAFKGAGLVGRDAPEVLVFRRSGLLLYLMRCDAPMAREFRWFVVDTVIPEWERGRAAAVPSCPSLPSVAPTARQLRALERLEARAAEAASLVVVRRRAVDVTFEPVEREALVEAGVPSRSD